MPCYLNPTVVPLSLFLPIFKKPTLKNKELDFFKLLWCSEAALPKGNDAALHLETYFLAWLYS